MAKAITLSGDKKLKRKLKGLRTKIKGAVRKGSRAGAKIIQQEAKNNAPKDTGKLKKAIKVRALPRSRVYIGAQVIIQNTPYAGPVEYGTEKMEATEFYKRAVDTVGDIALEQTANIIAQEIRNAV